MTFAEALVLALDGQQLPVVPSTDAASMTKAMTVRPRRCSGQNLGPAVGSVQARAVRQNRLVTHLKDQ
jgi:hypothetical protein